MTSIDQTGQFDLVRSSEIEESFDRSPDCSPCINDVIDQDDPMILHSGLNPGFADDRTFRQKTQVITVEGDVEGAHGDFHSLDALQILLYPFGQRNTPTVNTDEVYRMHIIILLENLMGYTHESALNLI